MACNATNVQRVTKVYVGGMACDWCKKNIAGNRPCWDVLLAFETRSRYAHDRCLGFVLSASMTETETLEGQDYFA